MRKSNKKSHLNRTFNNSNRMREKPSNESEWEALKPIQGEQRPSFSIGCPFDSNERATDEGKK